MADTSILIVGAGPTGLMLALQLARRGIAFDLIDAAAMPGTASRAIAVHARTLEFYDHLGLADAVLALGAKAERLRIRSGGREVARFDFGDIGAGLSRFPYVFTLAQDDHERFLEGELGKLGIPVGWRTQLTGLVQHDDMVKVTVENAAGASSVRHYAWVCGCDGAHSAVRHALGTLFEGGTYEGRFFVADVEVGAEAGPREEIVGNLSSDAFVLKMPVRTGGGVRLVGNVTSADEDPQFSVLQPVLERLLGAKVLRLNWFSTYKVHHRVASSFRDRRCFLLGDAGHVHSPAGGQGMNTGIGDAVNLAWKLAAVVQGADAELLETYEAERLPFARQLVASTDRAFSMITDAGVMGKLLRSFVVPYVAPLAMRFRAVRRALFRALSQTGIYYSSSALSSGRAGSLKGGDRLPWVASLSNYAPLKSLRWHVQMHGNADLPKHIPVQRYAWSNDAQAAGFTRDVPCLVRPDGYLAAVGRAAVLAALDRWLPPTRVDKCRGRLP